MNAAKTFALLLVSAVLLTLPYGAKILWQQSNPGLTESSERHERHHRTLTPDDKIDLLNEMRAEQMQRIAHKEDKLLKLKSHMSDWYQSIEAKRTALTAPSPSDINAFNEEAAAYASLHTVTKAEASALAKLQSRRFDSIADVSDDDFDAFGRRHTDDAEEDGD